MKALLGVFMILAGIALGLYVGLWLMFIGGIIQFVNAVTADPVNGAGVGWGVVRIFSASFVGWLSAAVLIIPGVGLIGSGSRRSRTVRQRTTRW